MDDDFMPTGWVGQGGLINYGTRVLDHRSLVKITSNSTIPMISNKTEYVVPKPKDFPKEIEGVWIDELDDIGKDRFSTTDNLGELARKAIHERSEKFLSDAIAKGLQSLNEARNLESIADDIAKDQSIQASLDQSLASFPNAGSF